MSIDEFKTIVGSKSRNLVILENNIIDLHEWEIFHPGGKFALQKNLGKDVTKYFYGAYQLIQTLKNKRHTHSFDAMLIAQSLIHA